MNRPIKKVAIFCLALFAVLFVNANYIQFVNASSYSAHPDNRRNLIYAFQNPRGQIIVDGKAIATSTATGGTLKYQRQYTDGPLYAQATGYYSVNFGSTSIEKFENPLLQGTDSRLATQQFLNQLENKGKSGGSVVLTLNSKAQQAAYNGLANLGGGKEIEGAVVALDPKTGAILALVSAPSFDPNTLATHSTAAEAKAANALEADSLQPSLDRALAQTYPPGSTFKIITSAAAMDNGLNGAAVDENTVIPSPLNTLQLPQSNSTLSNDAGETCGDTTLINAFTLSCNTVYGQIGLDLGGTKLQKRGAEVGLQHDRPLGTDERLDLGLPAEHLPGAGRAVGDRPVQRADDSAAGRDDGRGRGRRRRDHGSVSGQAGTGHQGQRDVHHKPEAAAQPDHVRPGQRAEGHDDLGGAERHRNQGPDRRRPSRREDRHRAARRRTERVGLVPVLRAGERTPRSWSPYWCRTTIPTRGTCTAAVWPPRSRRT